MNTVAVVLVLGLMVATAIALGAGIVMMAKGGDANQKYGNRMMVWRVGLQAATIIALVLFFASK